jgi:DMSO reductase anchor subunit
MHPAFSVIFFTTASGAGYGMLMLFGILSHLAPISRGAMLFILVTALALVTLGLLSSTLHLGHPERAWRAFSQWRSSWLAREGVVSVATYVPSVVGLFAVLFLSSQRGGIWQIAGPATTILALLTVICTGMIYASLKPIPRWNNGWVVPVYILFSLATGAAWLTPFMHMGTGLFAEAAWLACALSIVAWVVKLGYWRHIDRARPAATTARAVGMEHLGDVRLLDGPHTGENFVMKEMGYRVARKHARRLRKIAFAFGGILAPVFAVAAALSAPMDGLSAALLALGLSLLMAVTASLAVLIERWLFFAEAEHMAMLYYGGGPGSS